MAASHNTLRMVTNSGSNYSTWIVLSCVLSSFVIHGVGYMVLRQLPRPTVEERDTGPIYQPQRKKKKTHRVKVVKKRKAPKPQLASMRPEPVKPRVIRRLRPRAPRPRAVARKRRVKRQAPPPMVQPALVDLTPSAGVNRNLTAGRGAGGFQTGTTALGDPTVAPNKVKRRKRKPRPVPRVVAVSPPRAAPVAVYLKRYPQVVYVPQMPYPTEARRQGIQGTVKLLVTIGKNGRATRVKVLRSLHHALDRLAVRALKRARFKPAMGTDGKPMVYTIRYRYVFQLAE